eukprot:3585171-Rhodomonas_salina.1
MVRSNEFASELVLLNQTRIAAQAAHGRRTTSRHSIAYAQCYHSALVLCRRLTANGSTWKTKTHNTTRLDACPVITRHCLRPQATGRDRFCNATGLDASPALQCLRPRARDRFCRATGLDTCPALSQARSCSSGHSDVGNRARTAVISASTQCVCDQARPGRNSVTAPKLYAVTARRNSYRSPGTRGQL